MELDDLTEYCLVNLLSLSCPPPCSSPAVKAIAWIETPNQSSSQDNVNKFTGSNYILMSVRMNVYLLRQIYDLYYGIWTMKTTELTI